MHVDTKHSPHDSSLSSRSLLQCKACGSNQRVFICRVDKAAEVQASGHACFGVFWGVFERAEPRRSRIRGTHSLEAKRCVSALGTPLLAANKCTSTVRGKGQNTSYSQYFMSSYGSQMFSNSGETAG